MAVKSKKEGSDSPEQLTSGPEEFVSSQLSLVNPLISIPWREDLFPPAISSATYTNDHGENQSPDYQKRTIQISGNVYLPTAVNLNQVKFFRLGGDGIPLIYLITFTSSEPTSGNYHLTNFKFNDTISATEDNPFTHDIFATLFLVNEDPKTSRGTFTTIIKSS